MKQKRNRRGWLAIVLWTVGMHPGWAQAPDSVTLPPLIVTPSSYTLLKSAQMPTEINIEEGAKQPLILTDVLRTAHVFPGVAATDFSARFQLRGSEKDDVLVRLDGMELYEPYHLPDFGGAMSTLDYALVSRAQLFMGGFPPVYGDRMGGVFDIQSVPPHREGRTLLNFDLANTQFLHEGAMGDGGYLLSARRGYVDLILELIDAIQPLDEKFRPRFFDIYGKVENPLTERQSLTVNALYARDTNFTDKAGAIEDLQSEYDNLTLWSRWRTRFSDEAWLDVTPYGGRIARDKREGETDHDIRDIAYGGIRCDATLSPIAGHDLSAGVNVRWAGGDYDYYETTSPFPELDNTSPPMDLDAELRGADLTAYVQDEWTLTSRVAAIFGARALSQSYEDWSHTELSPRVAVAVRVANPLTLRAAWGVFLQPIDPLYLPVEGGIASPRSPERATHLIAGAEWTPSTAFSVRAEGYIKESVDLAGRVRDVGRQSQYFALAEEGESYGGEIFVQHRPNDATSWSGGYAYAVANAVYAGEVYARDFDQRHTILVNGVRSLSDSLTLSASWRLHTGTPYTPVAFVQTAEGLKPRIGTINSGRVPPFHSLDARLTKDYRFDRWTLTAYFQALNLYFRNNIQEYSYDPANAYARVAESFLPFTPTFGLTAMF